MVLPAYEESDVSRFRGFELLSAPLVAQAVATLAVRTHSARGSSRVLRRVEPTQTGPQPYATALQAYQYSNGVNHARESEC